MGTGNLIRDGQSVEEGQRKERYSDKPA
jgi:hypothetical protein